MNDSSQSQDQYCDPSLTTVVDNAVEQIEQIGKLFGPFVASEREFNDREKDEVYRILSAVDSMRAHIVHNVMRYLDWKKT